MKSKKISDWLREYLLNARLSSFIVGVSGGIDSAVASTLAAQTGEPTSSHGRRRRIDTHSHLTPDTPNILF